MLFHMKKMVGNIYLFEDRREKEDMHMGIYVLPISLKSRKCFLFSCMKRMENHGRISSMKSTMIFMT